MSESTQAQLDALKAALLEQGVATVCSKATDSQGRPLIEVNLKTGEFKLGGAEYGIGEPSQLCIDPGQEVEPLRMGKVSFYGESARQIRAANAVLHSAGAGQLEVVKRANEPGEQYVVVDGQMFISQAAIDDQVSALRSWKTQITEQGKHVATGIYSGEDRSEPSVDLASALADWPSVATLQITDPADQIRQVICDELKPGGMLHRG
ncbi:hypothetical protein AB688_18160 [Pseudomonas putida]|uniref:hypothetical protein n=1 Tax=Pseudomonas putida TaxID=303 RepID=UPI0007B6E81F|nr:hypothetical protein [Pseudomonas putida]ANC03938.1 hypothetical protein AB688_18160 [Pseudomonas putida]